MTNRIATDPETKQLISERESELAGYVRQLRDVLWEQLRRPSTASRKRASQVLETTRGLLAACPDDQPELWLDPHTIAKCAGFLRDIALERADPSKGDPDDPIPAYIDPATLAYAAALMLEQLPDVTGSTPAEETLASAHRDFLFFARALDRYESELRRYGVADVSAWDAPPDDLHLVDRVELDADLRTAASTPALCGRTAPRGWVQAGETCRMCAACIELAIERGPVRDANQTPTGEVPHA